MLSARRIDLHTHSTASDGTVEPAALMHAAAAAGLDVIALTDHDTTGGHAAAAAALPVGLSLVRGAEISCVWQGISVHLLAYLFDPLEPAFAAARAGLRASRLDRAERMVGLLADAGYPVTWEQVRALADGTVGRPHIASALMEHGLVPSVTAAFTPEWLGSSSPYYVAKADLEIMYALELVAGAGGVTVLAHSRAARGRIVPEETIAAMAAAGLTGIEVDHLDHDQPTREQLRGLAAELDLVATGGSDFHGQKKTFPLGAELTSEASLEALMARATGAEVLVA